MSSFRITTLMMAVASLATLAACNDGPSAPARAEASASSMDPLARRQGPGGDCIDVSGTIEEWSLDWPNSATGTAAGWFTGITTAQMEYTGGHQGAPTFAGTRTFTTGVGTVTLTGELMTRYQKVVYRKVTGDFTITGGTGAYDGASGEIQITGTASFDAGNDPGAHLEYEGQLCGILP